MSVDPRVSIHPDSSVLMAAIAARLITKLVDVQDKYGEATVVLTGGTVGIGTLKAVADSPAAPAVDWSKVNFWWGDERFLPAGVVSRRTHAARPTGPAHFASAPQPAGLPCRGVAPPGPRRSVWGSDYYWTATYQSKERPTQ